MFQTHSNTFFFIAYLQSNLLGTNERYPHIVYVKQETFDDIHMKASSCAQDQKIDLEGLSNFLSAWLCLTIGITQGPGLWARLCGWLGPKFMSFHPIRTKLFKLCA